MLQVEQSRPYRQSWRPTCWPAPVGTLSGAPILGLRLPPQRLGAHSRYNEPFSQPYLPMSLLDELDHLDWCEFEHLCLVLFEHHFDAPDANFYGANSVGQDGIDIRLTTIKGGTPTKVVIQCKARRSLDWCDFSGNFEEALDTFARKSIDEGRDLMFILATTADIGNTKKFDPQKEELVNTMGLCDIADRIHFEVFTGPRLRAMLDSNPALRKLFIRPQRPADLSTSQELTRLDVRLGRQIKSKMLASAYHDVAVYLERAKVAEAPQYDWVPTVLFDPLADLTLGAGDFERAHSLLNAALGADPLDARYQLGYLRARRVLHAAPLHNLPRANAYILPPPLPAPEEDVGDMAPQLLAALGDMDYQLTLALWVVSYARQQDLAEQGLSRALGLVAQAWPTSVERLQKDAYYVLGDEGHLDLQPAPRAPARRPAASSEHQRACALTVGYQYIRTVHGARFNYDSVRAVESKNSGWPAMIEGLVRRNATTYFAGLHHQCQWAMRNHLPSLLAEGAGREFDVEHTDQYGRVKPLRLECSKYAATPEFLLRDCERGLVGRRIDELACANPMNTGVSILISHLGLERLIQVQLAERIGLSETRGAHASTKMANGIADILKRLRRYELDGDERFDDRFDGKRRPFISRPCYANFAVACDIDSRYASIELARNWRVPFLASSLLEVNLAKSELPHPLGDPNLLYWQPELFSA